MASCYGYAAEGPIDLRYLRHGAAEDTLSVSYVEAPDPNLLGEAFLELVPTDRNPVSAHAYQTGERIFLDIDGAWFSVIPERARIGLPKDEEPVRREQRLWGFPSLLCFSERGDVPLHAASVEVEDMAIILCGPSHHGKTTLAAAFHQAGHRLLSEDLTCVRPAGSPMVLPGPAGVRLRHDVVREFQLVDAEEILEEDDRVHYLIASHRRGTGDPVRLGAVLYLKGPSEAVALQPRQAVEAIPDLSFLSYSLPDPASFARKFERLAGIAAAVPHLDLTHPYDLSRSGEVVDEIVRRVGALP